MTVKLLGSSSGSVSIDAPASTTGGADLAYTLPDATTGGVIRTTTTPGAILQVVQTYDPVAGDLNSGAIAGATDYTLMSRTITPAASSSKVLIMASIYLEMSDSQYDGLYGKLMRDSTQICLGDAAGSRNRASFMFPNSNVANRPVETSINYLDSPATTSEITYSVRIRDDSGAGSSIYFNRGAIDTDSAAQYRLASTLICMDVAG